MRLTKYRAVKIPNISILKKSLKKIKYQNLHKKGLLFCDKTKVDSMVFSVPVSFQKVFRQDKHKAKLIIY